jgi:hypothetical protein
MITRLGSAFVDPVTVKTQVLGMPLGTNIEIRLKNNQIVRGARGEGSDSGFMLVGARGGDRQIAFENVVSVKRFTQKSHTGRHILIGVGITLLVLGIIGSRL